MDARDGRFQGRCGRNPAKCRRICIAQDGGRQHRISADHALQITHAKILLTDQPLEPHGHHGVGGNVDVVALDEIDDQRF